MRFESLQLNAFGPFTNVRLNFGSANGPLHLVFGEGGPAMTARHNTRGAIVRCQVIEHPQGVGLVKTTFGA